MERMLPSRRAKWSSLRAASSLSLTASAAASAEVLGVSGGRVRGVSGGTWTVGGGRLFQELACVIGESQALLVRGAGETCDGPELSAGGTGLALG